MLHWGIDTSDPASRTLLDEISAHIERPAYWGRYLTGYPLEQQELKFLASIPVRIIPVYQATTAHPSALSGGASGEQGQKDAHDAVTIASNTYGIPKRAGIAIYADIEPSYTPSHYWIEAWIAGVEGAGYVPGLYCGSNQPGIIAGMTGVNPAAARSLIVWSSMPHDTTKTNKADIPPSITPPGFEVGDTKVGVDMWQYCLDYEAFDFNVATDRAYGAMWRPK